jgi:N-acetylglucosamine kinase-like BadF-type ATPase
MTTEERFERIEGSLEAMAGGWLQIQALLKTLLESQSRNQATLGGLMESIDRYVDAADARMKRIEENLDALIRAITAEHSNGKGNR